VWRILVYRAAPMEAMAWQGWLTLAVVVTCLVAMVREVAAPDLVMMAGLFTLAAAGVLTPVETFSGFANPALAAVGALFVVSAALRETGSLELVAARIFRGATDERTGLIRLVTPVAAFSAFLNNAPIVAMLTPTVSAWAQRRGLSASRFLIPLSYASILGSITTVIGTSTILTVAGLVQRAGMREIGFFELAPAGLPIAVLGLAYLVLVAPRLLPERQEPADYVGEHRREYTASMLVGPDCLLIGQTVEEAGLRHLPGLFLVEIDRGSHTLTPVGPEEVIAAGDRLVFAGVVATIVELQKIRGLRPVTEEEQPAEAAPRQRLVEAVISRSSPLVGRSIRDASFRTVYDAAVIAVHRNGERIPGKIGPITLRAGDTLLLQAAPGFLRAHRNSPDFFLTSEVAESEAPRHEKAWLALAILAAMVLCSALGIRSIYVASFLAAGLLILTRCITAQKARAAVIWQVLIVIGAGLGIAGAMEKTGAAAAVASVITSLGGSQHALLTLAAVYLVTLGMAELLHHNASVAIMFPVAMAAAAQVGADPRPFVMTVAIAGCCAFAAPTGYQTHLIVYGPGGYRFTDFTRVGLPLDLLCAGLALTLIPLIWPL
jgi:di/tricarboxylate transporter